jgi:hypothetical protein
MMNHSRSIKPNQNHSEAAMHTVAAGEVFIAINRKEQSTLY